MAFRYPPRACQDLGNTGPAAALSGGNRMTTTTAPPVREETLAEIRELEKEIAEAERKHNIHKGHAKEYKAEFDSLVGQLRDKCRSLSDPMPLYETNGHAEADGWRTIPI